MKRRLMGVFIFQKPKEKDLFKGMLNDKLEKMPLFDHSVSEGESDEGYPQITIDIRPDAFEDADSLFDFLKRQVERMPWRGRFSIHSCCHSDPPETWRPCVIEEEVSG